MNPNQNPIANQSPVLNYGQPCQYAFNYQSPGVFTTPHSAAQPPPPWVVELMAGIKSLKTVIPKIAQIENDVSRITAKPAHFDTRISNIETKVNDVEQSCAFISNEIDERKNEHNEIKKRVKELDNACTDMKINTEKHQYEATKLQDEMLDIKSRSMRENLMFYGIPEAPQHTDENCGMLVLDLIKTHLKLDNADKIELDRAHRIGRKFPNKTRPIIAKFHRYSVREQVRNEAFIPEVKAALNAVQLGIGVQQPQEYRDARKALQPQL